MAYQVHNFQSGAKLYASQLNEMDAQIESNESVIEALREEINPSTEEKVTLDIQAGMFSYNSKSIITTYGYNHAAYKCHVGDVLKIAGAGLNADFKLWCYVVDGNVVAYAQTATAKSDTFVATAFGTLYINGHKTNNPPSLTITRSTGRKDITSSILMHYRQNVYMVSGKLYYETSNVYRSYSDICTFEKKVIIMPESNIKVTTLTKNADENWSVLNQWAEAPFVMDADTTAVFQFARIDGREFAGAEPLVKVYEIVYGKSETAPMYRLIGSVSQQLLIDDNQSAGDGAIQGMCYDGQNIWYYLSYANVLKKYNVDGGTTTEYADLGLGHGNDIAYNPNTRLLYVAVCEGNLPTIKTVNVDTMAVDEITLNDFDGNICSIGYSVERDWYVVIGGAHYMREGNRTEWTRKKMIVYDKNFDIVRVITLENDYSAYQGIDCDDKYIYFGKSYIVNGANSDKIVVYDYEGHVVNSFSTGVGEIEAIAKIDDSRFYIARNHTAYHGGYVYTATVDSDSYKKVVDVLYERYIV